MTTEIGYKILTMQADSQTFDPFKACVVTRICRSLKYGCDLFKLTEPKAYWAVYPKLIEAILYRPSTQIRIAVLTDEPDNVLGFAVVEGTTLHYVHVDTIQRRQGIATALVSPCNSYTALTHATHAGIPFWSKVMPHAKFNPFKAFP